MSIDLLLKQVQTQSEITIPDGWGQGRATFGGLIGSLMFGHVVSRLGELAQDRLLRSVTISFIGAVTQDSVQLSTEIFRSGKSVTQASARLTQHGELRAVLLASFGSPRNSVIDIVPTMAATTCQVPGEECKIPYVEGVTPEFLQQVDARLTQGAKPFSGSDKPDFGGWMRWHADFPQMTVAHLLGLIDAWPPSVLPMLAGPANASTLCWTVEFLSHSFNKSSQNWWQYEVVTDYAKFGYAHAQAYIWDDEHNLVAISRQVSTIFA